MNREIQADKVAIQKLLQKGDQKALIHWMLELTRVFFFRSEKESQSKREKRVHPTHSHHSDFATAAEFLQELMNSKDKVNHNTYLSVLNDLNSDHSAENKIKERFWAIYYIMYLFDAPLAKKQVALKTVEQQMLNAIKGCSINEKDKIISKVVEGTTDDKMTQEKK